MGSIGRAVNLCESTLAFGKAEEPPPALNRIALAPIVNDAVEGERLAASDDIRFEEHVASGLIVRADPEQLYRVLSNLIRNARQAMETAKRGGVITVSAGESSQLWTIEVRDNGPGLPAKAREHLFTPFQGGARKGGAGLGLAIAAELVRGHGGTLRLDRTGEDGTVFIIELPKSIVTEDQAAE